MWDLPRPGLEPTSPALAGRFSTTAPPGKPKAFYFNMPTEIVGALNMFLLYLEEDLLYGGSLNGVPT